MSASTLDYKEILNRLLHPVQVKILETMARNPDLSWSPKGLSEALDVPLTHVSYHVRRLATAKLIRCTRKVPMRGVVSHHYKLTGARRSGRNGR
jgi:DNA-binding MarR family transcriptional regulator